MKTTMIAAAIVLLAAPATHATIVTMPSSLNPGDSYRLAFVTSGTRDATSSSIAVYNQFVTNAANAVTELANLGTTWTAIGSTPTVDARDNTNTVPSTVTGGSLGVPIFLLNDTKLVDSNDDLWDGSIDVNFDRTELDTSISTFVMTGTIADGTGLPFNELGAIFVINGPNAGRTFATDSTWISLGLVSRNDPRPFYALSGELTVVPEPTTCGLALAALCLAMSRRRSF